MRKQKRGMDKSLARFLKGEGELKGEFAAYEAELTSLKALRETQPRNKSRAEAARSAFLQKARSLPQPVPAAAFPRLKKRMHILQKENSIMRTLVRSILVLALALGGTTATAFAAQSSMPDDALYPVKLMTEDVRLALTSDPEAAFNYLLNLAEERTREVAGLADQGLPVPNEVSLRLQEHLQQALKQAGQMDDPAMMQAMQQIQTMTQSQFQFMEQTSTQTQNQEGDGALENAQETMLQIQSAAQGALDDPAAFRTQQGTNRPETAPDRPDNQPAEGNSDGNESQDAGKGSGGKGGSDGSGEGECTGEDCDPLLKGTPMPDGTNYYPYYLRGRGYGRYW